MLEGGWGSRGAWAGLKRASVGLIVVLLLGMVDGSRIHGVRKGGTEGPLQEQSTGHGHLHGIHQAYRTMRERFSKARLSSAGAGRERERTARAKKADPDQPVAEELGVPEEPLVPPAPSPPTAPPAPPRTPRRGNNGRATHYTREDLAVSVGQTLHRHYLTDLMEETFLHGGIKGLMSTNSTEDGRKSEPHLAWEVRPDEVPPNGYFVGDRRWPQAVALTNETFQGRYKWMLVGDDDTSWFIENVLEFLEGLDHNEAYFLTDNWGYGRHNFFLDKEEQMEKLKACQLSRDQPHGCVVDQPKHLSLPRGGSCSVRRLCECGRHSGPDCATGKGSDAGSPLWGHGGSGAILSLGLVNSMDAQEWLQCCHDEKGGADARLSSCLWRVGGVSITDPSIGRALEQGVEWKKRLGNVYFNPNIDVPKMAGAAGGADEEAFRSILCIHTAAQQVDKGKKTVEQMKNWVRGVYDEYEKFRDRLDENEGRSSR